MNLPLNDLVRTGTALPQAQAQALLRIALVLRSGAQPLLQGKQLALVGMQPASAASQEIAEAASALGARVSRLPPDPLLLSDDCAGDGALRMLARLYDAIAIDALDAPAAARLQAALELPVYSALPSFDQLLAAVPKPSVMPARPQLVQALLVLTLVR